MLPNLSALKPSAVDGPVQDLFDELGVREKLVAQLEMQKLLARLKAQPPEPPMTVEFYASAEIDPDQTRPIALLFLPDWKGDRVTEFGTSGEVVLKHRTSIEAPYPFPFSFVPRGFRLVDPPDWLKFNDTPSATGSSDELGARFLWVSQDDVGHSVFLDEPSHPVEDLTNIGPAALERTLSPEFAKDWVDTVILRQGWELRERSYRSKARGLGREPDRFTDQPVASTVIYMFLQPSVEERTRRVRNIQAYLQNDAEYKELLGTPDPERTFRRYGAANSKVLIKRILEEMKRKNLNNTYTAEGGTLSQEGAFMVTHFVPAGVSALEAFERSSMPDARGKRARAE